MVSEINHRVARDDLSTCTGIQGIKCPASDHQQHPVAQFLWAGQFREQASPVAKVAVYMVASPSTTMIVRRPVSENSLPAASS